MNTFKNGTVVVGAPNSYQWYLAAFKDALNGKQPLKVFEVHMFKEKIKETGLKAGLSIQQMGADWDRCHEEVLNG